MMLEIIHTTTEVLKLEARQISYGGTADTYWGKRGLDSI